MLNKLKLSSRDELIKKWWKVFDAEPPEHARKEYLLKQLVWELQARKYGGYSAQTLKKLYKLTKTLSKGKADFLVVHWKDQLSKNFLKTLKQVKLILL